MSLLIILQSTVNFISGEYENQKIPHETQYLNLVKSRWILQMIRESSHFKEAGPGSLWARCIKKSEMVMFRTTYLERALS
jgi:hypothetical protein